jgi:hypothetical protein
MTEQEKRMHLAQIREQEEERVEIMVADTINRIVRMVNRQPSVDREYMQDVLAGKVVIPERQLTYLQKLRAGRA